MLFNRSLLAGLLISIGAMAYLSVGGVAGALCFAVGLVGVITLGVDLFTGKMVLVTDWKKLAMIWIGNFMGCAIGSVLSSKLGPDALVVMEGKVAMSVYGVALSAVLCGFMMACATVPHALKWGDRIGRWMLTIGCVVGFIVIGADHCIADTYYWFASGAVMNMIWVPLVATVGNYLGGWLFKLGMYEKIG